MNHNNEQQNNTDIKQQVLEKISAEQVTMKPRVFFLFQVIGLSILVLLTLLTSALLISYVLFALKVSGQLFLLGFGLKGFIAFIMLFPWWLLIFDCILILIIDTLLKRFRFAYHSPSLHLFLGTLFIVAVIGYCINLIPLHRDMMRNAHGKNGRFKVVYQNVRDIDRHDGVFSGTVVSIDGPRLIVQGDNFYDDVGFVNEIIDMQGITTVPAIVIGDHVFVAGDRVQGIIRAYGIQKTVKVN